ncbi:MAG: TldD/PmbA family protein [Ignisphaera sp.]
MIDVERIIEKGIRKAEELGATEVEIYVVDEYSTALSTTMKGFEGIRRGSTLTADVRVAIGKKVTVQGAIISTENDLDNLIEKAISIAKIVPEDPQWVSLPRDYGYTHVCDIVDERIRDMDETSSIELLRRAIELPKEIDVRAYTTLAEVELSYIRKWIGNSYEKPLSYDKTSFYFAIDVKAVENGYESSYHSYYLAPTLREFDMNELIKNAVEVAVLTIRSKPIDTGSYNVIFMPQVLASILRTLIAPALRADQVQKNRSPLIKKLFSQVLSEEITIIDDGVAPNMIRSAPFDDEGVAMKRKTVVDKGVLLTYLYDTYTAYIDNQESTGNAVRHGLASPPVPDITNIILLPGTSSIENIVNDLKEAIVVYATIGEWLSNPVNGNLGATVVNAVYFKNGTPLHGVKGVTISGNIYNLLDRDLVAVSRDIELVGNMLVPAICSKNVAIAGK